MVSPFYVRNTAKVASELGTPSSLHVASEGIGVIHVAATSIDPALAQNLIDRSNLAFVDAMTSGFWISVGFIAIGLATSRFLLPQRSRTTQVERNHDDELTSFTTPAHTVSPLLGVEAQ